jgi:hypothetical protein
MYADHTSDIALCSSDIVTISSPMVSIFLLICLLLIYLYGFVANILLLFGSDWEKNMYLFVNSVELLRKKLLTYSQLIVSYLFVLIQLENFP